MIRQIVQACLSYRYLVIGSAIIMVILGINRLREMPVDVFPEFAPPYVEIQTEALGLSAQEVESLITLNLEEFISGVSWLHSIRSESVPGLSSIQLVFEPGTNLMQARQLMQERLSLAHTMPNVSKPPVMLQPQSIANRALMIGLSSQELSPIQLSVLAQWMIKPRLLGVPGVANVVIWGQRKRQLQVQIDSTRLRDEGVTQEQIIKTSGDALWVSSLSFLEASVPGTGGWIDTPNQRLGIQHVLPITTPEDFAKMPVFGSEKTLSEVANVVEGHPPMIGDVFLNDGMGLMLVVEKLPGVNTLEVTQGVEKALAVMQLGLPNVKIDPSIYRSASYIEKSIDNLTLAIFISLALVMIVLGFLLLDWRAVTIIIITIPLSLLSAVLVLYFRGDTINTMVLAGLGIALGIVVDDAIIDIQNIRRRIRESREQNSGKSLAKIIVDASFEVRRPIIYATLIIVLAMAPVFFLSGVAGKFFHPLALSYSLALLISMVTALTVTPALSYLFFSKGSYTPRETSLLRWLKQGYNAALLRTIRAPGTALISVIVLVIIGIAVSPFFNRTLLPDFKDQYVLIELEGAPGTSHQEMSRIVTRAVQDLKVLPGVQNVGAHIGRAEAGDKIVNINKGQLWVNIDPTTDYDKTLAAIKTTVNHYEGLDRDVHTQLKESISDLASGNGDAIVVRIYGADQKILHSKAEEVKVALEGIKGISDLEVDAQIFEPHIEVKVDLAKARPYGIKPGDVRRAASTIFAGLEVGNLFEQQKVFDVMVWGAPATRQSIDNVRSVLVETSKNGHVRLDEIADVRISPTPTVIKHEAISSYADVNANITGSNYGAIGREVERRLSNIQFPLEYHPELRGEYVERQDAYKRILIVSLIALIGIFLLLQAAFNSWRLASLAFLTIPTALVGGILAAMASGGVISIGSLIGLLTVLGIAARNGILLIDHYQQLQKHEGLAFGPELVLRGSAERLAPILMTALTTAFALLPLIYFGNIAGLEIEHPMAVVILGGLLTATLLNIFLIPSLYLRYGSPLVAEEAF